MTPRRRATIALATVALAAALGLALDPGAARTTARTGISRVAGATARDASTAALGPEIDDEGERPVALPAGGPTALACDDARLVVAQARSALAAPAAPLDAAKFADATSDWLDPHGMWSVAPDAPVAGEVRRHAERLLADLEAAPGSGPCVAAEEIGASLAAWADELRRAFDAGAASSSRAEGDELWRVASSTPFEDGVVTRNARDLARSLGHDVASVASAYGEPLDGVARAARERAAPELDRAHWGRVVVAAALRAYVPQLDAHGAWAPLDEEMSIYDLALETDPPERLWTEMTRTAVGVRVDRGALAPLVDGDVVLRVHDTPLAGVSVEQAEQLSVVSDGRGGAPARVTVLRHGAAAPIDLLVAPSSALGPLAPPADLAVDEVRYGDGRAFVVTVTDVPDDLGARLAATVERARGAGDVRGILLDVRQNGGGSTDGAIAALGLFLPDVPLFPMRRRDGGVEVERSPDAPPDRRWTGPVAVLVDGDSASAAEMIAGAIASYHRGPVLGERTYGKGCAQEYLDDDAHAGVLRLTTLLYALPDGSPVQKVGISPTIALSLPPATEKEAGMPRALGPWHGPDVRDATRVKDVVWTAHGGRVGPCHDETVCRALRVLGSASAARAKSPVGDLRR